MLQLPRELDLPARSFAGIFQDFQGPRTVDKDEEALESRA